MMGFMMKQLKYLVMGLGVLTLLFFGVILAAGPGPTPEEIQATHENATLNTVISSCNQAQRTTEAAIAAHEIFITDPKGEWEAYFDAVNRMSGSLQFIRVQTEIIDYPDNMQEINRTSRNYIISCESLCFNMLNMDGFSVVGNQTGADIAQRDVVEALKQCDHAREEYLKAVNDFERGR